MRRVLAEKNFLVNMFIHGYCFREKDRNSFAGSIIQSNASNIIRLSASTSYYVLDPISFFKLVRYTTTRCDD